MYLFRKICFLALGIFIAYGCFSQVSPETIFHSNIQTVRFHIYGDQASMPVLKLSSSDKAELHFDDLDGDVKNYYYSFQLCDYTWQPVNLSPFDYVKGFTQQRISTYRFSSIAYTRYTHYQVVLPENNSIPTRSGNYMLKVFLDGDTSKLAFTRCFFVLESKATISAQVLQPFTPEKFRTHQRLKFSVNIEGLNTFNATQQVKVVVMQNNRWDNAQGNIPPTFVRGSTLEYNSENNFVFAGGKEWRWLDLRSLRLQSDRVQKAVYKKDSTDVYVKTDTERSSHKYVYYQDLNGQYQVTTYETINPYWQGDYATVYFSFAPPNYKPYLNKDVYLFGQLSDYDLNEKNKMKFNEETGLYEVSAFLKQGFYSYGYLFVDSDNDKNINETEGNNFETENSYTIFIYYKSFTDRSDQLIGVGKINTRIDRPGFSF
jgi:hypothetical protein